MVNVAVVPLMNEVSKASAVFTDKKLLSTAISRGFTSSLIWSPTLAPLALAIEYTGADWLSLFPYAILCSLIAFLTGYILTVYENRRYTPANDDDFNYEVSIKHYKVIELIVFILILFTLIAVIIMNYHVSTITVVSFASLIFPVIWMLYLGRLPLLYQSFRRNYFNHVLPNLSNEIILFTGAGLLAGSITYSHLGNYIPQVLSILTGNNGLLITIAVLITTMLVSALGIHPIITVIIFAETINPATYGFTPEFMALLLTVSWAMGLIISPSSATIISLAGITKLSPFQIGIGWNRLYVFLSSVVLLAVITFLRCLGLI